MRLFGALLELILIVGLVLGLLAVARRLFASTAAKTRSGSELERPPRKDPRENQDGEAAVNKTEEHPKPSDGDSMENSKELAAIARRRMEILAKMAADAKDK